MTTRVTYVLDLFRGDEQEPLSEKALKLMLAGLMLIDEEEIRQFPGLPPLYKSGVRYQEQVGREDWQDALTTYKLQAGDCKCLACWRAAELRVRQNVDARPMFTFRRANDGPSVPPDRRRYLFHIVVLLPDGTIEDPSKVLGMR